MASWSACGLDAVAVVDGECVQDGFPGVDPPARVGSVLPPFGGNQVQNFQRGLLVGEVASVADGLAEPGVQALNGVDGVHDRAELDGVVEEGHELAPGLLPGVDHRRVAVTPGVGELGEAGLGGVEGGGGVDLA
jgi:hypothetical protein